MYFKVLIYRKHFPLNDQTVESGKKKKIHFLLLISPGKVYLQLMQRSDANKTKEIWFVQSELKIPLQVPRMMFYIQCIVFVNINACL